MTRDVEGIYSSTFIKSSSIAGDSDYPTIDQLETAVLAAQEHTGIYCIRTQ